MRWIAPYKNGPENVALVTRLRASGRRFWDSSSLIVQEFSALALGWNFHRFVAQRAKLENGERRTGGLARFVGRIPNLRRTRALLLPRLLSGQVELKPRRLVHE